MSTIRFMSLPRTSAPPEFIADVVEVFRQCESRVSTICLSKGLTSDAALAVLHDDLRRIGFIVESGKQREQKIDRPVFFGENGLPILRYEIDAYHPTWRCGFEIEAGRAWMGNAVYRDLLQASVMVGVDHLILAVPLAYKYVSGGRPMTSPDYERTIGLADTLYGHSRLKLPYGLTVIGY